MGFTHRYILTTAAAANFDRLINEPANGHHSATWHPRTSVPTSLITARSRVRHIDSIACDPVVRAAICRFAPAPGMTGFPHFAKTPPVLRCALVAPMRRSRHADRSIASPLRGPRSACHSLSLWPLARRFRRSTSSRRPAPQGFVCPSIALRTEQPNPF